ncbi:GmrSD restriction endonuclease domain-containing protein [Falsihalocynthiibacter arcticus]|uniref:GmrSD restriction endonucleases N-terminal domain-containing protein n=1 Tax=Falsihalocynthiibacter arcticus TaxID=1579316 RepID=A0A126UYE8_9RHOB|nr:DUF262 domain-containing protein [Falsihalocynthiibacter arcticus]AML50459.1 hypothetical protein RC74_03510 [Falsihalocynthiibacter arcticus]
MKTFDFDDIGIAKIFSDYSLSIPPHQRDYAWTEDEVGQLFSDLEAAYRNGSEYFLGTIVAIESKSINELVLLTASKD